MRSIAVAFAFLLATAPPRAEATDPAVMFNTTCAHCHEGECGGFMTFQSGSAGAMGHIRRHAGEIDEDTANRLFESLTAMKRDCAYPQPQAPIPENGRWESDALAALGTPSGRGWFVPLGRLSAGPKRLVIDWEPRVRLRLHLLRADFDPTFEGCLDPKDGQGAQEVDLEEEGSYFLRLLSDEPARITRLAVE